ncbi:sulfotransferase family 2 domain-containing protein [Thalassomonas viridans]|uniref:Sulfotransferase family 2 domain-containing protein n=1 Tax=Thalassomonas viridans TaxID=137584 RepID=A0AAE9Z781_9GAMM|nr:sulfotransferase family 2 domain-containing protein [Thalassomonas viridans]WDE08035.1 sulfotransferase family 2 domain-containing protein [Thalassomonas viridans]
MPHFYHARQKLLISTSYKVMYTRLVYEQVLQPVAPSFLPRALEKGADHYVIVRNPCHRLSSFFKDKFRRNIRKRTSGNTSWQQCQRLFFPQLGLEEKTRENSKKQRFLQTSYADFIGFLPQAYQQDPHLQPQYYLLDEIAAAVNSCPQKLTHQLVHLESRNETTAFARRSGINLGRKVNSTQAIPFDELAISRNVEGVLWQKIYQLYHTDFKVFGYAQPWSCQTG